MVSLPQLKECKPHEGKAFALGPWWLHRRHPGARIWSSGSDLLASPPSLLLFLEQELTTTHYCLFLFVFLNFDELLIKIGCLGHCRIRGSSVYREHCARCRVLARRGAAIGSSHHICQATQPCFSSKPCFNSLSVDDI